MNSLFGVVVDRVVNEVKKAVAELGDLPLEDQVNAINRLKVILHEVSPFREEPVDCILWIRAERVAPNGYNPNAVAPPEMRLLEHSIRSDGYTQPVVAYADPNGKEYTVVDGAHRTRVGRESRAVRERVHGYLPVAAIRGDRGDLRHRMAATIRHNRARGVHGVDPMVDIVASLETQGWTDDEVCKELGMDVDEVLRFKQVSGLPGLFKGREYSRAWE